MYKKYIKAAKIIYIKIFKARDNTTHRYKISYTHYLKRFIALTEHRSRTLWCFLLYFNKHREKSQEMKLKYIILVIIILLIVSGILKLSKKESLPPNNKLETSIHKTDGNIDQFKREDRSTLRVCQGETPPSTLDPITFVSKQEEITFHIFDRLVKWDSEGKIVNDLAEHIEQLDKYRLKIKLLKGIEFHNGEPLDARSVKFSIERVLDPKTQSPMKALFNSVKDIQIVDDHTITINTKIPDILLKRKLAFIQILPYKYFNEVGAEYFGKNPVGTSSYMFKSWAEDGTITLVRNKHPWQNKKPEIKKIIFKFIQADSLTKKEQIDALINHEVDLITELPGINSKKIQMNPNIKLIKSVNQATVYKMSLNSSKAPFNDIKLRKAVNLGINRDVLIKILAKGNGKKIATNTINLEFGHNSNLKPYPYAPAEARQLIEEVTKDPINISVVATEEAELVAKAIAKDLERINIITKLDIITKEELAYTLSNFKTDPEINWNYDMAVYYGIDQLMHVGFLYEEALYTNGSWSLTSNKEVDRLINKLKVTFDKEEQEDICHRIEEIAYNNYWYTPVFQVIGLYGASKDLNIKVSPTSYIDLTTASFDNISDQP